MSELDQTLNRRLQQLLHDARQHPSKSARRRMILSNFVQQIAQSGQLAHPQKGRWPPQFYEDLYNEALQKTLLEVSQKIDNYNSDFPVMAWVNQILNWRFIDVVREVMKMGITQISQQDLNPRVLSLDELENQVSQTPEPNESQNLRALIEADPDGIFKEKYVKNCPHASFQSISLMIFADKTWDQISQELNIPLSTASSFYQRCSQKFIPYFQEKLISNMDI